MLLTLTNMEPPATDLGYLLHKHPGKVQAFPLAFGAAHVFYPEATETRCTAALLLEVDPIGLVRGRRGPAGEGFALEQYVNDRPYVASSFLSVAIAQVLGTALSGRCAARPELPEKVLPLEARLAVLPCHGGEAFLRRLFEPLGYEVTATPHALDAKFPDWGGSNYHTVILYGRQRLQDLLSHLYVLIPVLDNDKHYWVGREELEKLLRHGEGWLAGHPEREAITLRYLKHQRGLARAALARLAEEDQPDPDAELETRAEEEAALEASIAPIAEVSDAFASLYQEGEASAEPQREGDFPAEPVMGGEPSVEPDGEDEISAWSVVTEASSTESATETFVPASPASRVSAPPERGPTLNAQRLGTVLAALKTSGARSVLDLGCGEGKLLRVLLDDKQFERVVGLDVAYRSLEIASDKLRLERMPATKRRRLELLHGSLTYRDARLAGFDAAAVVEVIEHLDPARLAAFERVLFEFARPRTVVLTTPNREYNVKFPTLPALRLRHRDHRFEWTRAEFRTWAQRVAERFGYDARFLPIGAEDEAVGAPTQMGIFSHP